MNIFKLLKPSYGNTDLIRKMLEGSICLAPETSDDLQHMFKTISIRYPNVLYYKGYVKDTEMLSPRNSFGEQMCYYVMYGMIIRDRESHMKSVNLPAFSYKKESNFILEWG